MFSIFLRSLAKPLCSFTKIVLSLTKPAEFEQTHVFYVACSGSYSSVHSQCSISYSFILNLDSRV